MDSQAQGKIPYHHPSSYLWIDGILHEQGVTKDFLAEFQRAPLKGDEIFLATYPKSGTTWLSEVTWRIFSGGLASSDSLWHRVPFLETLDHISGADMIEKLHQCFTSTPEPRVFKTHLPYDLAPKSANPDIKPKYIYLLRNPKDCAVSYYHHYKGFKSYEFDEPWDVFFELFMKNEVAYGSWFDHVLGWWAHRDDPNVLVLKYEDMSKDLPSTIKQIAQFVGKTLSDKVIQQIAEQTSFSAMSKAKGEYYNDVEEGEGFPRVAGATKFLRKGQVGDWRNFFTEDQSRRLEEVYKEKLAGSGLDFDFLLPL